jgi:hypothetical protein
MVIRERWTSLKTRCLLSAVLAFAALFIWTIVPVTASQPDPAFGGPRVIALTVVNAGDPATLPSYSIQ